MQRNGEQYEHDHNGEDAAGDEEDEEDEPQDRGKKKVSRAAAAAASQAALKDAGCRNQTGYIGVRQRKWGMFAAEIRDGDKRRWLGSFGSGREAGMAYDAAAISQKGSKAKTNFRYNDFSSAPRMDAETEEKVRWDLLPKDIAEKFPIPADPFGSGAGLDAVAEAHAAAAAAAPSPAPAPPAPARRAPAPPAPEPVPEPESQDLSNLFDQQRHSKRNRPSTTPSAAAAAPVAPPVAQPPMQPRAPARYPAPYPPMVDAYGPDEEAHLAAMAAAASFYSYPAMYPHLDQDAYDAQVDAAAATAAYRHYGLMNGMHPGTVYDDPLAGMMPGPSMPPAPMRGSGSMGRERERERERERSSAKKRDYAQVEALHAGHMRQQPDEGGPDHSSRHARNGSKAPSSSRGAAAGGGGPASSRSAAHAASMAAAYDYALGVGAAHMGHPYAYTMAAGLPHYNSKAYMLAAPAFAGRYPGSDGGGRRGSPSRSLPYSPSNGGGPGSSGRQHSEAPGSHRSRLRHTDDNVAQPPSAHGRGHSHGGGGGGGGDRSKSTSPREPGPGYEPHPSMMHYADMAATGYPGYEHMMPHPGYMPHHALYPGQYPALAAAAEPPPSLYTSTPGPTTGGTLVRPRAVHAKPEHAAVPGADALVGYLPGAFQPYHPAMGYRYHLDQAMLHSHYATLGHGPDDGPDDEDGDGAPNGIDEGPPRHRWRDAGGYQPEGPEEMMAGGHHLGGSGAAPSRNGAADPPMLTGDHAAIVAAAAVSAQQQQEQEQQHRR